MSTRILLVIGEKQRVLDLVFDMIIHEALDSYKAFETDDLSQLACWGRIEIVLSIETGTESMKRILNNNPVKWVHSFWTSIKPMLIPELTEGTILFTRFRKASNAPLAEFTIAAILHFSRQLERLAKNKIERSWDRFFIDTLVGKRLGILGLGSIGQHVARIARLGFGMDVIGFRRTDTGPHEFASEVHTLSDLHTLLPSFDFLVMVLPSTPETFNIIGEAELNMMKPTAVLINIGRGYLLDEVALSRALNEGRIRGAALDVFKEEPLPPDHFLWTTPNLFISPHYACVSTNIFKEQTECFIQNLTKYIEGEKLLNEVCKIGGY